MCVCVLTNIEDKPSGKGQRKNTEREGQRERGVDPHCQSVV